MGKYLILLSLLCSCEVPQDLKKVTGQSEEKEEKVELCENTSDNIHRTWKYDGDYKATVDLTHYRYDDEIEIYDEETNKCMHIIILGYGNDDRDLDNTHHEITMRPCDNFFYRSGTYQVRCNRLEIKWESNYGTETLTTTEN